MSNGEGTLSVLAPQAGAGSAAKRETTLPPRGKGGRLKPLDRRTMRERWFPSQPSTESTVMPQAMMDPEEVRRFAEELKRFNMDLQNRLSSLQARFATLGDTWQDQEHVKFSEEFK